MEIWNVHLPELMSCAGQGRVFFGSDAGEILFHFHGGDMDDSVSVFWGDDYLAEFRAMDYPVQPRINVQEAITPSKRGQLNKERWLTEQEAPAGNRSALDTQRVLREAKEIERDSESPGSFINRGWIDFLLSGEHRTAIKACIEEKGYIVPSM